MVTFFREILMEVDDGGKVSRNKYRMYTALAAASLFSSMKRTVTVGYLSFLVMTSSCAINTTYGLFLLKMHI